MGRIEKVAGPKQEATIPEGVSKLVREITRIPIYDFPTFLRDAQRDWPFPRGDLYHWIPVLNKFDDFLERFASEYGLDNGPQTRAFGRTVVVDTFYRDFGRDASDNPDTKIDNLPYGAEVDREVVESILDFSRLLLDKCGHRSLFNSSERLNALLNTTSLSLLQSTLRLGVSLSQRYHANLTKQHRPPTHHPHSALLATHYNIDLDRVQALATPFPRPALQSKNHELSPTVKGKEKADHEPQPSTGKCNANDFICLTRGSSDEKTVLDGSKSYDLAPDNWHDWGTVRITYYPRSDVPGDTDIDGHGAQAPMTPSPMPRGGKSSRLSGGEDMAHSTQVSGTKSEESSRGTKVVEISQSDISSKGVERLLRDNLEEVPQPSKYDLLNRLRIAYALSTSPETRRQILAIRLLSIANLAYIYPEAMFQQRILLSDSDEPKRLQLAYQLAEYVHLGVAGDIDASTLSQAFAFTCLDGLARHKSRTADVCAALNVNVNHGILMFIVRKAVASLGKEDTDDDFLKRVEGDEGDSWREALFSLLRTLLSSGDRRPETLVSAGLVPMLVDILNLRTDKARGIYPRIMEFLDLFVHTTRDALATLASAKGFDAISELISSECQTAFNLAAEGKGIPKSSKTPATDYQIPYSRQLALKWLFKFVNHVMQNNRGGFERVLRNLIDSPPLLAALQLVLENAKVFGSLVWSGAVNIVSHFIHNEPTSYAVIAEAGLSRSFLEAVMGRAIDPQDDQNSIRSALPFLPSKQTSERGGLTSRLVKPPETKGSNGILPSSDAIICIPMAFGAICLNSTGLDLFQSTDALERFFDIFESPEHVKAMENDQHLLRVLGNSFDELIRHHPPLKDAVMSCVIRLVARIGLLAKSKAWEAGLGAKLWTEGENGQTSIAGGPASVITDIGAEFTQNIEDCQSTAIPGAEDIQSDDAMSASSHYGEIFGPPNIDKWESMDRDKNGLSVADYLFPVVGFLSALFDNQSICSYFIECGGAEYLLDFATLQSVPSDFRVTGKKCVPLAHVIHLMAESKPHIVIPSVVRRAEDAIDKLEPFWGQIGGTGFFSPLTTPSGNTALDVGGVKDKGTYFAKHLVAVNVLTDSLREVFNPPLYATRSAQQMTTFTQANMTDKYVSLLKKLGLLHAACVWEEILLQKELPEAWNDTTGDAGSSSRGGAQGAPAAAQPETTSGVSTPLSSQRRGDESSQERVNATTQLDGNSENGAALRNVKTLRFLLGALPSAITGLCHTLGRGLITKRRDMYQRQNAVKVADAIAAAVLEQLDLQAPKEAQCTQDHFSYLIVVLSSFSRLLFQSTAEGPRSHCLTMVLHAFKQRNGLRVLKDLAGVFLNETKKTGAETHKNSPSKESSTRLASAYGGIKIILTFFSETTSSEYINGSSQTQAMSSNDRNRDRPDFLLPAQFIVELRMAALSLLHDMWGTPFMDNASDSIVKSLIEILRVTFEGQGESGAYRRNNVPPPLSPAAPKPFSFHRDLLNTLIEKGYDEALCKEALYRCNNIMNAAEDYCAAQQGLRGPPRNPIPSDELEAAPPRVASPQTPEFLFGEPGPSGGGSTAPTGSHSLSDDPIASLLGQIQGAHAQGAGEGNVPRQESNAQGSTGGGSPGHEGLRIQDLLNTDEDPTNRQRFEQRPSSQSTRARNVVTVDDLDRERDAVRSDLIERCLDVLNYHHDLTFELADLIAAATTRHHDAPSFRREVGETLMHFLISLQMDENFETAGKKIAGYANLLALVLQDKAIYDDTLEELKENFSLLLGFIKLPTSTADKPTEEACPWVGQVLLIMERILSDDAQPQQIQWSPPDSDDHDGTEEPANLENPAISPDDKMKLFESVVNILPRVGKSESLALSVCRILVILTRQRNIAVKLGEKRNLQRLFVMVKQLSNASDSKFQSALMLILRHIIEDDETIRQIMRSEITASFEQRSRAVDTTSYVRQFYHLVLRAPQLFVEVTNEKLKLHTYDSHQRPQLLVLKQEKKDQNGEGHEDASGEADNQNKEKAGEQVTAEQAEPKEPKDKAKPVELKTPVVENPDGVIHYLLSELLSYRDVEDKEPPPASQDKDTGKPEDVVMTTSEAPATSSVSGSQDAATKKPEKRQFKPEEHPIYIYRCFLLQCLAELLASYNRTKVEFINFSRKGDAQVTTPSKPRSGVINYLLHVVIPVGTLEHDESIAFKKRVHTSNWAMRVIVALCSKTGEFGGISRRRNTQNDEEEESDLLFVRKFVLEHALRSYKEANASNEPLDSKYARLMSLADLFDKMLSGSSASEGTAQFPSSSRQIAKTMFEKNFIAAFTSSVADIDLNFPGSKRAVKYILRPLNKLTQTAVVLSETASLPSRPGETDEDEISSATSVSDMETDREETPDLFRHSTLGMFEPDHEDMSTSEESEEEDDDEMYDEYDEEMYDDEEIGDRDPDDISDDEDEDDDDDRGPIEGLPGDEGMDVEVLLEDDDGMSDDENEDDDDDQDDDDDDDQHSEDDEAMAGEITADRQNGSLDGLDDEGEWESDEFSEEDVHDLEDQMHELAHGGHGEAFGHQPPHLDSLLRVLEETGQTVGRIESDMDMGRDAHDDMEEDEGEMHEDEEEEIVDDLEEEMDDPEEDEQDEDAEMQSPWEFDEPIPGHGHVSVRRRPPPPFSIFPGGLPGRHGILPVPSYGGHNHRAAPQRNDDGTNPLLRRPEQSRTQQGDLRGPGPEAYSDWIHAIEPGGAGQGQDRPLPVDSPVTFVNAIMQVIGQGGPGLGLVSRPDGFHVHVDRGSLPQRMQHLLGGRQQPGPQQSRSRDDPIQAVTFSLTTTPNRWQEESRLLYGSYHNIDKAQRIVNSLLKVLVPPAIEEEKERKKRAEEAKRLEEERLERERRERLEKEEAERERKRKEEEEEARRQQEEAERAAEEAARQPAEPEPMEDVQPTTVAEGAEEAPAEEETAPAAGPSEPRPQVHTTIRGRQIDITGMDIDPEYLEALPEEIREEVIMQQLAEQRSHAAAAGEEPSEINPEFLEALPSEIREELLQQEAADRRRRERETARREAASSGAPQAEDMDPASFIATLEPSLRQTVLADQPEDVLASLGPEFVSEARALSGRRLYQYDHDHPAGRRREEPVPRGESAKKPQRRPAVQLLDKAGVATLLRLMFMTMHSNVRHNLNDVLHNVCQNRQNRMEVISLLLLILQDGSADISAVERGFAHLSLRAKTPPSQKTPQTIKRSLSLPGPGADNDVTPLMVIQQCLSALSFLTQYNPHISWFFLTEHETPAALKLKASRKGKSKENRASKFPLNSLLSLLDRKVILDSPSCMEQLSALLSSVTQPLTVLLRKEKEKAEEASKEKADEQGEQEAQPEGTRGDATMTDAAAAEPEQREGQPAAEEQAGSSEARADEQKQKKQRTMEPPVIPESNLQLVVRVLAARECNAKTSREIVSAINNLSAVPGAKEVFGKELISQAKTLSQKILADLDDLLPHIEQAQNGTDVQGMALSKFTPSGSDQAKLLRVLTALDYLFDPHRTDKNRPEAESWEKADVLKSLYESATFNPLWSKLSDCLAIIRRKENMLNVATILLPVIESLMVVCKNTSLKDIPLPRHREESTASGTSPESGMESLFFQFTEDHRKILNELVRQNPRLMSGSFALLVKNPKVLEFDNKRNYFNRRIHSRGTDSRRPHPPLQLSVRRDQVFLDSFKSLYFKSADEMKYGKLSVRFHGEEGVDAGGVTREWFQVLARGMFNPNYALFIPVASDRTTFHPNRLSGVNQEHLTFFKFIGRIIGKALYEGRVLDCHFSRPVYKRILGRAVSIKDMETLDLDYYKSLVWMLENDITDIITETFSVEVEDFGETQVIDLVENGRNIPVTQENKEEYVQRVVEYRLTGSVQEQLDKFLEGFHDIIPADLISIFNEQELELLISGLPEIDVADWKNHTEYHTYTASSPQIQWFWRAVRSFDKEERAKLLQFVTGTSKVPLNGFRELEGMNGFNMFNIHKDYGDKDRLPTTHTCFNQLDLPEYDNYETLRKQLYTAMTAGSEYFGFA